MATELGKAYIQVIPSAKGIKGALSEALGGEAASAGEKSGSVFAGAMKTGISAAAKTIAAGLTAATGAVTAFGVSAVKTGSEFDSSMSQIAATLGMTTEDIANNVDGAGDTFDKLREKADEMGRKTIFSASEAAEGLNILAMSGYDANQSMEMVEDVLHLAAAGSMDMASAAGYVSGAMKGFNDETKDSGYYADLMAKGATLANTNVQQLGEAISSGAAGAAAYSQSADSMTVALLRLAEQGEVGSAAGTALSAAMKNLYTPTNQAKTALDELGVAAYTSTGEARDFNEVVNELDAALSGYTEEQQAAYKQTIFGIQGLNAYNKMTVTGIEKQEEWAEALAKASDGAGEAAKQYDTMTANLEGDIAGWNSALDGFKIAIADGLMPEIRKFVQFGSEGLNKITDAFKTGGLSGAMEAFGEVLSDGIAMVIEFVPDMISAGMQLLSALGQGLMDNIDIILWAAGDIMTMLFNGLLEATEGGSSTIMEILDWILGVFEENYMGLMDVGAQILLNIINGIAEALPDLLYYASEIIQHFCGVLVENLPLLIQGAFEIIAALASGIGEALPDLIPAIVEVVLAIVSGLIENIGLLIEGAIALMVGLAEGIINALPIIIEKAPEIVRSIVTAIIDNLPLLIDAAVQITMALAGALIENLPLIAEAAVEIIGALVGGLIGLLGELVDGGANMVEAVWEGIKSLDPVQWGKDLIASFVDGIKAGWDALTGAVTGAGEAIKRVIGFSEPEEGPLSDFHTYGPDMMALFAEGIASSGTQVTTALTAVLTQVQNTLTQTSKQLVEQVITTGTEIVNAVDKWLNEVVTKAVRYATETVNKFMDVLRKLPAQVATVLSEILKKVSEFGTSLAAKGTEAAKGFSDAFLSGFKSLGSEMESIGKDITNGLWNGISSGWSWLEDQVRNLADGLKTSVQDSLEIHSPSRQFYWIGEMVDRGFAEGISDHQYLVDSAMGDMLAAATPSSADYTTRMNTPATINVYPSQGMDERALAQDISFYLAGEYSRTRAVWSPQYA